MKKLDTTMAQQVAQAVSDFQQRQIGYAPKAVSSPVRSPDALRFESLHSIIFWKEN